MPKILTKQDIVALFESVFVTATGAWINRLTKEAVFSRMSQAGVFNELTQKSRLKNMIQLGLIYEDGEYIINADLEKRVNEYKSTINEQAPI